jgi:hypothetical protein
VSDFDFCCCTFGEAMCLDCLKGGHRACRRKREQVMTLEDRIQRLEERVMPKGKGEK